MHWLRRLSLPALLLSSALLLLALPAGCEAGKKKKKKGKKKAEAPVSDKDLFDSNTLKCLVCQNLVDEFLAAVHMVDPAKMVDTGTFRIDAEGSQQRSIIPFARSQQHLMELVDKVCENFEDYAQGKSKSDGSPTVIRLTTPEGNMNPKFGEVDLVPDDDLNTKLKFYCEGLVEDLEDDFTDLLSDEKNDGTIKAEICYKRSKVCAQKKNKDKKKKKKDKKEEL